MANLITKKSVCREFSSKRFYTQQRWLLNAFAFVFNILSPLCCCTFEDAHQRASFIEALSMRCTYSTKLYSCQQWNCFTNWQYFFCQHYKNHRHTNHNILTKPFVFVRIVRAKTAKKDVTHF